MTDPIEAVAKVLAERTGYGYWLWPSRRPMIGEAIEAARAEAAEATAKYNAQVASHNIEIVANVTAERDQLKARVVELERLLTETSNCLYWLAEEQGDKDAVRKARAALEKDDE